MRIAVIAPTQHVADLGPRPYNLAFAEHTQTHAYWATRIAQGATVLLDTLVHETTLRWDTHTHDLHMQQADLSRTITTLLNPTFTVVPNVISNMEQTLRTFHNFVSMQAFESWAPRTILIGVLGGNTRAQITECARVMASATRTLAIPIEIFQDLTIPTTRYAFYKYLKDTRVIPPATHIHFLGLEHDFASIIACVDETYIMGVDTAKPWHSAISGLDFKQTHHVPNFNRPPNFFDSDLPSPTIDLARSNTEYLDKLAHMGLHRR